MPLLSSISQKMKVKLLLAHLSPESTILEVGAGSGWLNDELSKHGLHATTLDINKPADIVCDINNWRQNNIKPHEFDVVVAFELIEHVDCLDSLKNICKKDGLIMLSSPHPHWYWTIKILEALHLNQKRTSPHVNLTDFKKINLPIIKRKRPLFIHQVAIFKNA